MRIGRTRLRRLPREDATTHLLACARLALLTACLAALLAPAAANASAYDLLKGTLSPRLARIVSPTPATVAGKATVQVRVRTATGVRSFRAWLDETEVTRSFRRAGRDRVATLRAPALGIGVNHLHVRVRDGSGHRDYDTVRFVSARRASALLGVKVHFRRVRGGRARLTATVGRRADTVRATLNGRRLALGGGRRRLVAVDGDQGLRFGRNLLRIVAVDEAGRFDVERRRLVVKRTAPIPAAGRDRRVKVRRVVRLDARRTRAAHKGASMHLTWRLVGRPRGSKARLRGTHSARPRLRPDRAGRYRLRMVVRQGAGPRAAAAATAMDVLTVHAVPDIPLSGVAIDTISGGFSGQPSGVKLGAPINQFYEAPNPALPLQLVILDRQDLTPVLNQSYKGDADGTSALLGDVNSHTGDLAIIATPNSTSSPALPDDPTTLGNLNSALEAIGARGIDQDLIINPDCSQGCSIFSAIGVPGLVAGQGGTMNPGLRLARNGDSPPSLRGDLRGFLQVDSAGNYTYVNTDYVPFDTVAPGSSPTNAVVKIGGDTYTPPPIAAGQAGFFVLVLDSGQLNFRSANMFVVNGVSDVATANALDSMDAVLETAANDGRSLVIVQTVGNVQRVDSTSLNAGHLWDLVAHDQTQTGGSELYLHALDGSAAGGSYAFVAAGEPPSTPSPWAQTASQLATRSQGRLTGLLARNDQSQFYPKMANTLGAFDVQLPSVVLRNPVPWPDRDTPGHNAAIACVAASLDPALTTPIESHYTNTSIGWDTYSGQLGKLSFASLPANAACQAGGFTAQDFTDVQTQLTTEWGYLPFVNGLMTNLQEPLIKGYSTASAHVGDIAQAVTNEINAPNSNAAADARQIGADSLWIASSIPEIGSVFGLLAGIEQLAGDLSNQQDGAPDISTFQAAANDLPDKLGDRYQTLFQELDHMGDMLRTDYGKLATAAQLAVNAWAWDDAVDYPQARDAFDAALKKWAWDSVFPVGYDVYGFNPEVSNAGEWTCTGFDEIDPQSPTRFMPFANLQGGGITVTTGAGPTTDVRAFGKINEQFLIQDDNQRDPNGTPSDSLLDDMFVNVDPNSTVPNPAEPSQLRFLVDNFAAEHILTFDDQGVCYVDGKVPGGD